MNGPRPALADGIIGRVVVLRAAVGGGSACCLPWIGHGPRGALDTTAGADVVECVSSTVRTNRGVRRAAPEFAVRAGQRGRLRRSDLYALAGNRERGYENLQQEIAGVRLCVDHVLPAELVGALGKTKGNGLRLGLGHVLVVHLGLESDVE